MLEYTQELMTPHEAARWFRRSPSWLRQQHDLVRLGGKNGQPLYHTRICRAFVYGKMCALPAPDLRELQLAALAVACGLPVTPHLRAALSLAAATEAPGASGVPNAGGGADAPVAATTQS